MWRRSEALKDTALTLDNRYPEKLRLSAIDAVDQRRLRNPRDRTIFREVAKRFSVGEQSLRLWVKKNDSERVKRKGNNGKESSQRGQHEVHVVSSKQFEAELDKMRRQIEKLKAENDVLKRAFVVFSAEWSEAE